MIKRLLKNRFFYLALAVLVLMGIIGIKLYSLQIVNGSSYDKMVTTRNQATVLLDARRGNIYDKNGVLLAGSEVTYKLQMTYVDKPQAERDNMYLRLINLLESNGDTCVNKLAQYIGPDLEWGRSLAGDENSVKRSAWISTIVKRRADKERIETAMDAFRYLRNELFEIADSYNNADAYKIMTIRYATRTEGLNTMTPMTLSESISEKSMIAIENGFLAFPGVYTDVSYKRVYYHTDVTSHIVGYVRKIDAEEYAAHSGEGYSMEDIIGKVGIEASCESILRGTKGKRELFYDRDTGRVRTVSYTEPKSGSDVYLTIDVQLQRIAYNALIDNIEQIKETADPTDGNYGDANAGSVVMEDARTGKIIAMASYPSYDSNIFVAPSGDAEAQEAIIALYADENSPSLNRATQGIYPIGSTFKPIDAVAALEVGLPGGRWHYEKCTGLMVLDDMNHRCLAVHGSLGMDMAFTVSCNMYFQQIALLDGVGIENLDRYAKMFGLGEKTGIEINEYAGYRSNRETMELKETDKSHVWSDSDTAQTAIGQLYTQITPLQLCNYAAALGNGGYRNQRPSAPTGRRHITRQIPE